MEIERVIERQKLLAAFRLHSSGHRQKAEMLYQKIIGVDPRQPDSLHILAGLAFCMGENSLATEMVTHAIQLNPDQPHYYGTLGNIYKKRVMLEKAITCYQKALQLDSVVPEFQISLGSVYHLLGRVDDAMACYQKALTLKPDSVRALVGLGAIFKELGRTKDAAAMYSRSLEIQPDVGLEIKFALLFPVICQSNKSIQRYRDKIKRHIDHLRRRNTSLDDPYLEVGKTSFHLAYHGMCNKDIHRSIASLYLEACSDLSWVSPARYDKRPADGKIDIGIISRFLHQHTIGHLNYGIIKHINRDRFRVKVLRFKGKEDPLSEAINQAADEVIYLPDHLRKARRIIAEQALDILFYLDIGMDALTYFLAFSRLAPVQCTTWGHADTTGIPNMDYYLSSALAEPLHAQQHYSEQLVLLNRFPMYCQYPQLPGETLTREEFGLPTHRHLYMCCQSLFKFHPEFDAIIKAILERDQDGILLLFEGKHTSWGELLRDRFARTIPEVMDRIYFHPRVAREDFLAIISLADVMLDTIHFCGGYTSLLAFACGVPIVTLPGEFMRGRMTQALYKQIDMTECIAEDPESYVDLAVALATDKNRNRQLRRKIKRRSRALFEDIHAVNELEDFFERSLATIPGDWDKKSRAQNKNYAQRSTSHEGNPLSETNTSHPSSCRKATTVVRPFRGEGLATVTIITPTYQRNPDIVQRNIACIRAQTYPFWRHIICSDGVFEKPVYDLVLREDDARRTYCVAEKHYGDFANSVRHEMLTKHADTEYVLFYDDDNIILPNYLEKMIGALAHTVNGEQFVICQLMHFGPVIKSLGEPPVLLQGIPKVKHIDTLQVLAKTKAMKTIGWLKRGYCSDGYTFEELAKRYSFVRVNECLALHM